MSRESQTPVSKIFTSLPDVDEIRRRIADNIRDRQILRHLLRIANALVVADENGVELSSLARFAAVRLLDYHNDFLEHTSECDDPHCSDQCRAARCLPPLGKVARAMKELAAVERLERLMHRPQSDGQLRGRCTVEVV